MGFLNKEWYWANHTGKILKITMCRFGAPDNQYPLPSNFEPCTERCMIESCRDIVGTVKVDLFSDKNISPK